MSEAFLKVNWCALKQPLSLKLHTDSGVVSQKECFISSSRVIVYKKVSLFMVINFLVG